MTDIEYLNERVWATLKPSPIHGIGVFAIRDIPIGTIITDYSVHNIKESKILAVPTAEFDQIHKAVRELILDRTMFRDFQNQFCFYSPNYEQTLQSFMNHSNTPNTDGHVATRDIKEGEELTENYIELTNGDTIHPIVKEHVSLRIKDIVL